MIANKETKIKNPKRWTWHLFLFANIILTVCIAISWIWTSRSVYNGTPFPKSWYVPIMLGTMIYTIMICIFYYFESKEFFYLKMHVPKKCFNYYLFSGVFCILAILLSILMTSLMLKIIPSPPLINKIHFAFGLMFGIVVGLTLIAVALYRYGKNCIEVAIYKRKHGENLKNQNELLNQKNNLKNMSEDEIKLKRKENEDYSSVTTATSNLINNVDKEQENSSN